MPMHPKPWYLHGSSNDAATFSSARHLILPSSCLHVGHRSWTLGLQPEHKVWPFEHCNKDQQSRCCYANLKKALYCEIVKDDYFELKET